MKPAFQLLLLLASSLILAQCNSSPVKVSHGKIHRLADFPSKYVDSRHVDVWLPEGYSEKKRYAVLYMHDGQMLFDASTTWNKQEWGVDETLSDLLKNGRIQEVIVVGIWNNGAKRHSEYFPQKAYELLTDAEKKHVEEAVRPTGNKVFSHEVISDRYLKFIVEELKPFIDATFATRPEKNATFIAGSSMGGLISMYALLEYPEVFYGAACISTHWPGIFEIENNPVPQTFLNLLEQMLPQHGKNKLYFDYGTETLDALYPPYQAQVDAIMRSKGWDESHWITKAFPGEDHSENAWQKRLHIPIEFLLTKTTSP